LVGTPTSYLLRSTCSSAELPEELRAAERWCSLRCVSWRDVPFFPLRDERRGFPSPARASTRSSFPMACPVALPPRRAMAASSFLLRACNFSSFIAKNSVGPAPTRYECKDSDSALPCRYCCSRSSIPGRIEVTEPRPSRQCKTRRDGSVERYEGRKD